MCGNQGRSGARTSETEKKNKMNKYFTIGMKLELEQTQQTSRQSTKKCTKSVGALDF